MAGCRDSDQSLPPILFLRQDDAGLAQIYLVDEPGDEPRVLTAGLTPVIDVHDFAVAPDGESIAYSAATDATGTVIRRIDADGRNDRLVLACPAAECSGLVWAPDGKRLVFEQRLLEAGLPAQPRLYWLDMDSGRTSPLIEGDTTPSFGATFSPDGQWISYVSPGNDGVILYNLVDGRQRLIPSRVGRPPAWSPDSADLVLGDLVILATTTSPGGEANPQSVQESSAVYLYRVSLNEEGARRRLSPEGNIEDSVPAWSPDGTLIAFGRRAAGTDTGRQLWVMDGEGDDARSLTGEPSIVHGPPAWSPDGRYLLFQRFDMAEPASVATTWLLEVASGDLMPVVDGQAYQPAWLEAMPGPP